MKKLFLLIVCAVLSIGARAQFSGSGKGTETDPYRIYTDTHLSQMANFLDQEGVVFELMKDVDLSDYISVNSTSQGWTPIGVESAPFKGVLKGNGHTISGLMINRPSNDHIGLFGYVNGARINNLTIKASDITGQYYVSVLCGTSYGSCSFVNCDVEISGKLSGLCDIGGIVGYMHEGSTIKDCDVKGNIESKAGSNSGCATVGGVGGTVEKANVSNCTFNGKINAKVQYAGGLLGSINGCSLNNCKVNCSIAGENVVGGLCGNVGTSSSTFNNCHHKGIINNTGDYTGGLIGRSEGARIGGMESCSHFGDITGKNYVGGIVGASIKSSDSSEYIYISTSSTTNTQSVIKPTSDFISGTYESLVNNCTAIGNITGLSYVGGIAGWDEKAIGHSDWKNGGASTISMDSGLTNAYYYLWYGNKYTSSAIFQKGSHTWSPNIHVSTIAYINSYYSGIITGTENVGGIAGYKWCGRIQNCYTHATVNGNSNVGGIIGNADGYSTSELTLKSNVAINNSVSADASNTGRIYGKGNEFLAIGAPGSTQCNRALTQTSVMLCGVAQDIVDNEQNGTSIGPSMLKLKGNYVSWGWNFDNDWDIQETECYPYKRYQAAPPVIKSKLESHDTSISGQSLNGGTVYMYYKDREAVSTKCNGNDWTFNTEALQSGAQVQLYADVDGMMTPSYLTTAIVKYPGSGTEEDPWRIYTADDLQGAYNSGYYKVMNNIDLTSWINENSPVKGWPAIGRNSTAATYIDGENHTISGLWINTTEGYNGLFSNYSAGYIKNLNVEVASGKKVKGGNYTGILIGRIANAKIINCTIKGDVESNDEYVGGVAGRIFDCDVTKVNFAGSVLATGAGHGVGGLAGAASNSNVEKCSVIASITASVDSRKYQGFDVAGLIATCVNVTINNCKADVTVKATGSANSASAGGLVGYLEGGSISSCSTSGEVNFNIPDGYYQNTGGLVGSLQVGQISNSYSTANVTGTLYTAGLVGLSFGSIDKCYASGNVKGKRYGAGLVGEMDGSGAVVTHSVAANNLVELTDQESWGCRVIGGFRNGAKEPTLGSNYALSTMQVSINNVPQKKTDDPIEGVAKSAEDLQKASTYTAQGWDLENLWTINDGYPVHRMESGDFGSVSVANPMDATNLIKNPNYDEGSAYWEGGLYTLENLAFNWNETTDSFDFYQTLTDLPNGVYQVQVHSAHRIGSSGSYGPHYRTGVLDPYKQYLRTCQVYANNFWKVNNDITSENIKQELGSDYWDRETINGYYIPVGATYVRGCYNDLNMFDNSLFCVVTDGVLKIGVRCQDRMKASWTTFDKWRLTYYGSGNDALELLKSELAKSLIDYEGETIQTNLSETYNAAKKALESAADFAAAEAAYTEAMGLFYTIEKNRSAYKDYINLITEVETLTKDMNNKVADNLVDYVNANFDNTIKSPRFSTEEIEAETQKIKGMLDTAIKNDIEVGEDISILIPNHDMKLASFQEVGWAITPADVNITGNKDRLDRYDTQYHMGEAWQFDTFDMSYTLTGMPAGIYELEIPAVYRNRDHNYKNTAPVEIYVNDQSLNVKTAKEDAISEADAISTEFEPGEGYISPEEWGNANCYNINSQKGDTNWPNDQILEIDGQRYYIPGSCDGAAVAFYAGRYINKVHGIVGKDGILKLGIRTKESTGFADQWVAIGHIKMTYIGKNHEEEVTSTDIASMDNVTYVDDLKLRSGMSAVMHLNLKNSVDLTAMEFSLVLPKGMSIDKNARGNYDLKFNNETERADVSTHNLSATDKDGSVFVLCYSNSNDTFLGNEGAVIDIPITIAENMESGKYPIYLKNILLTTPVVNGKAQEFKYDEIVATLEVLGFILGDANADEEVNVTDIVYIVNHLQGNSADDFVAEASDLNEDGQINVTDIVYLVNYLQTGIMPDNGQNHVKAKKAAPVDQDNILYMDDVTIDAGQSTTLELSMKNSTEITAMEFSLVLPEGVTVDKNRRGKYDLTFNAEADRTDNSMHNLSGTDKDGAIYVLCYSNNNDVFYGNDGAIINIPISLAEDVAPGVYDIILRNVILTGTVQNGKAPEYKYDEITIKLNIPGDSFDLADGTVYTNANTQKVSKFTYTRKFGTTNWQSLYLPVAVPVSTLEEQGLKVAYINNFNQYDTDGDDVPDELKMEIFYIRSGVLLPNYPYMVKAVTTGDKEIVVENAEVMAADEVTVGCSSMTYTYEVTGTYHKVPASELSSNGCYVVSGGALKQLAAGSTASLGAERWYLKITPRPGVFTPLPSEVKIEVMGEGIADGIHGFTVLDGSAQDGIYDLQGRKVSKAQKGVYIQNGKKIFVK